MSRHYIEQDGKLVAVDLMTWARWFEHADRQVARDQLADKVRVSTVFLGLNHALPWEKGLLLVYETMVFGPDDFELNGETRRYASRAAALAGHADIVQQVRAAISESESQSSAVDSTKRASIVNGRADAEAKGQ